MVQLLPLTYTRPAHVRRASDSTHGTSDTEKSGESVKSGNSGPSAGIPESLTFDKIISGGTCPPMTVRDFMNYLQYVEHAAENLQFYLWLRDYEQRFAAAPEKDRALAPEWTQAMQDDAVVKLRKGHAESRKPEPAAAKIFQGTDFEKTKRGAQTSDAPLQDPFQTPPRTPHGGSEGGSMYTASTLAPSMQSQVSDAYSTAGVRNPFTIQPFREEVDRIIATYIMDGASRQLNLSAWEQKTAVHALSYTTHPSAFRGISRIIDTTLRRQAHSNFVRWSICNGNPARVLFARCLGVGLIVAGFVVAILLTLSSAGRGYRAIAAVAWVLGISTLVAAYKGMCVVLHGMHHRHVRPWELFSQDGDEWGDELSLHKASFDTLASSSNSYEDEPWVVKYEKRNVVRKIFDREVWIQEPALRQIQDTIFVQAMLAALLAGGVLAGIFVALPGVDLI